MIAFRRPVAATEAEAPPPAPFSPRNRLRTALAAAAEAWQLTADAAAAVTLGRSLLAEHQADLAKLDGTSRAIAEHGVSAIRAGKPPGPLPPDLAALRRIQEAQREVTAGAVMCADILETEYASARHGAEAADATVSAAVDVLMHEAAAEIAERMREAEIQAGRLRLALIGALVGGPVSLIGFDDGHGPEIRAAENAGFRPDPGRWTAFRAALAADPEARFVDGRADAPLIPE